MYELIFTIVVLHSNNIATLSEISLTKHTTQQDCLEMKKLVSYRLVDDSPQLPTLLDCRIRKFVK